MSSASRSCVLGLSSGPSAVLLLLYVLRLCSFSRIASRARCAHDAAESDTHESSARAYTRRGAHLSRPPVTLSSILVAPPPCDPASSSLPSAWWPRSSILVAPSDAGCSRPRCIPRGTTAPVSFVPCAPRVRVCHRLSYFSFRTAPAPLSRRPRTLSLSLSLLPSPRSSFPSPSYIFLLSPLLLPSPPPLPNPPAVSRLSPLRWRLLFSPLCPCILPRRESAAAAAAAVATAASFAGSSTLSPREPARFLRGVVKSKSESA